MSSLRATAPISAFVLCTALAACTQGGNAPPAGGDPGDAAENATLTAEIGPLIVEPGVERTQCVVFRLSRDAGAFARRFRAELTSGSHHMTLYKSVDAEERLSPFDCLGFDSVPNGDKPMFISQQRETELALPTDDDGTPIGFKIEPNQMVRLEMHYVNATPEQLSIGGKVTIDTVPLSTKVVQSDIAFWGTVDIQIPPNASYETPVKFMRALPGTKSFALTTHQHRLATRMRVWYADDANDTALEPIADCTDWSNPPLERFDPPLVFGGDGKAGLAYQCAWNNPTPRHVSFGESVDDEMCIVWHYYYPAHGFHRIVQL